MADGRNYGDKYMELVEDLQKLIDANGGIENLTDDQLRSIVEDSDIYFKINGITLLLQEYYKRIDEEKRRTELGVENNVDAEFEKYENDILDILNDNHDGKSPENNSKGNDVSLDDFIKNINERNATYTKILSATGVKMQGGVFKDKNESLRKLRTRLSVRDNDIKKFIYDFTENYPREKMTDELKSLIGIRNESGTSLVRPTISQHLEPIEKLEQELEEIGVSLKYGKGMDDEACASLEAEQKEKAKQLEEKRKRLGKRWELKLKIDKITRRINELKKLLKSNNISMEERQRYENELNILLPQLSLLSKEFQEILNNITDEMRKTVERDMKDKEKIKGNDSGNKDKAGVSKREVKPLSESSNKQKENIEPTSYTPSNIGNVATPSYNSSGNLPTRVNNTKELRKQKREDKKALKSVIKEMRKKYKEDIGLGNGPYDEEFNDMFEEKFNKNNIKSPIMRSIYVRNHLLSKKGVSKNVKGIVEKYSHDKIESIVKDIRDTKSGVEFELFLQNAINNDDFKEYRERKGIETVKIDKREEQHVENPDYEQRETDTKKDREENTYKFGQKQVDARFIKSTSEMIENIYKKYREINKDKDKSDNLEPLPNSDEFINDPDILDEIENGSRDKTEAPPVPVFDRNANRGKQQPLNYPKGRTNKDVVKPPLGYKGATYHGKPNNPVRKRTEEKSNGNLSER